MMAILDTIKNLKMINDKKCLKKLITNFFYENINIYINAMTGHSINTQQSQEFLSTMHTMIDDLDTISPHIDEVIYVRLVNGLQRLYNIHNTGTQTSTNVRETVRRNRHIYRENVETNNEVQITQILARHYGRVYDSSGVLISNEPYPINDTINANALNNYDVSANVINANPNIISVDANAITNENNDVTNQQAIYTSYVALYSNAFDYWNQPQHRFQRTN
jgi:hypothetical protein